MSIDMQLTCQVYIRGAVLYGYTGLYSSLWCPVSSVWGMGTRHRVFISWLVSALVKPMGISDMGESDITMGISCMFIQYLFAPKNKKG